MHSDLSESEARKATEELEHIHTMLIDLGFPFSMQPRNRGRVILFRREAEYRVVGPLESTGFFSPAGRFGKIGSEPTAVLYGMLTSRMRTVLQHELTHRFVRFYYPKVPPWLNEGLAHYYEGLTLERGYATLGMPAFEIRRGKTWSGRGIPSAKVPGVRAILDLDRKAFVIDPAKTTSHEGKEAERRRVSAHRAGAWALVHLFKNGPEYYHEPFAALMHNIHRGKAFSEAWEAAFSGFPLTKLDQDFVASLAPVGTKRLVLKTPYKRSPVSIQRVRNLSAAEVHLLWAALRPKRAETEIQAALRLGPPSTLPAALRMRAILAMDKLQLSEAERHLKQALDLAPGDAQARFMLLEVYAQKEEQVDAPAQARKRAEAILTQLLPQASSPTMQNRIAWHLGRWGRVDEAMPWVLRALANDPGCWECNYTLAMLLAQQGERASAIEAMEFAINLMPEERIHEDIYQHLNEYMAAVESAASENNLLSDAIIRKFIEQRDADLQRCYAEGLKRKSELAGGVAIRLVIEREGTISEVTDAGSTLSDEQVIQCYLDALETLRFPARTTGASQPLRFGVHLQPGDKQRDEEEH